MIDLYFWFPRDFDKRFKKYKEDFLGYTPKRESKIAISYNTITGRGNIEGKDFEFKDGKPEYKIFKKLFENLDKKVTRYDVLVEGGIYEDGENPDPVRHNEETEKINEFAKEIRRKTGLSTDHLVNNNGNLTLVTEISPK